MAKKSVPKKETPKSAKKEKPVNSFVAINTRPHTTESSGKLAARLSAWLADGKGSNFPDPNIGLMSRSSFEKMEDRGEVPYPKYNPVLVDLVRHTKCKILRRGAENSKPPKDWDEKLYGPWYHEWEEDGKAINDPSGWGFYNSVRPCHVDKIEKLIVNPEKNILSFDNVQADLEYKKDSYNGSVRIVCGTGSHDNSATFMTWQTQVGENNYHAGDESRKRMSLAGADIRDIVYLIRDRANCGGGVVIRGKWKRGITEMVYMPGQALTAGHLYQGGKKLDAKSIRGLDSAVKGIKFQELDKLVIGKDVDMLTKIWPEIQKRGQASLKAMRKRGGRSEEWEAGNTKIKSIENIKNHTRVDPGENNPFGMKGSMIHQVACVIPNGEGSLREGHFKMKIVIGARSNFQFSSEAKAKIKETKKVSKADVAPVVENKVEVEVEVEAVEA